jgi:hypothetical protein
MKHPSSRDLFTYWTKQRGDRPAPDRADIDPAEIRHALGDIFMLAADFIEEQRFRLAGTRVCALFGRELRGESFSAAFAVTARQDLRAMLTEVINENAGLIAGVRGRNAQDETVDLELLLLPLAHKGHARIRAIGALAAHETPYWIGERPIKDLSLGTVRHIGAQTETPKSFLPALEARLRRSFRVYQGGLGNPNEKAG